MSKSLTITYLQHLNLVVIKQKGVRFFVAAPDSFIIDGKGFLEILKGMIKCGAIQLSDIENEILHGEDSI